MINKLFRFGAAIAAGVVAMAAPNAGLAQDTQRGATEGLEAIYGLVVDPGGDGTLLLGTQYGLVLAAPDGLGERVGGVPVAVTGLTVSPQDAQRMFLSGYSETGAPAGVLASVDGGASWAAFDATAGDGGVVLSSMSVSRLDPAMMAGLGEGIALSDDGGQSWRAVASTPDKTFAVALSGVSQRRIFAATMAGLMVSEDRGASWARGYDNEAPATAVASLSDGRVAGFVFGVGFVLADEETLDWQLVATGFEGRYLTGLTEDPARPGLLYASVDTGAILMSRDSGRTWISYEGNDLMTPGRIAAGRVIYDESCQACHGAGGIGEAPGDPEAQDEFGFKAPALNNDMHAWHHSDAGMRATISNGSSRNQRMIAWQEVLSDDEINSVIAYVKSTWSIRSLSCQGSRHMRC